MAVRAVEIAGLRELRLELRRAEPRVGAELRQANIEAAEFVAPFVRRRAPEGPHQGGPEGRPFVSAKASVRAGGTQRAGYIAIGGTYSPHAQVVNFGGTIPRRGADRSLVAKARTGHRSFANVGITSLTRVQGREFLYSGIAAAQRDPDFLDTYWNAVERAVRRAFPKRVAA